MFDGGLLHCWLTATAELADRDISDYLKRAFEQNVKLLPAAAASGDTRLVTYLMPAASKCLQPYEKLLPRHGDSEKTERYISLAESDEQTLLCRDDGWPLPRRLLVRVYDQ